MYYSFGKWVIGADGFGFAPKDGHFEKIPQTGVVVIEDGVEVRGQYCYRQGHFRADH